MKNKRLKRAHHTLSFYRNSFNFRPAYQVLIDGSFCKAALENKVNIKDQLPKFLNEKIRYFTTTCVIQDLENKGKKFHGALFIVKQFPVKPCHHKKSVAASQCLLSLVANGNPEHFFVATQRENEELTKEIQKQPGIPLLYIFMNTIVLERPSNASKEIAKFSGGVKLSDYEQSLLAEVENQKLKNISMKDRIPKKKKAKGPHPLSCLKKKKKPMQVQESSSGKEQEEGSQKKRKRHRHRKNKPAQEPAIPDNHND